MLAVFPEDDRSFVSRSSGYRTLSAVLLEASEGFDGEERKADSAKL
jgi:hypothetical protein